MVGVRAGPARKLGTGAVTAVTGSAQLPAGRSGAVVPSPEAVEPPDPCLPGAAGLPPAGGPPVDGPWCCAGMEPEPPGGEGGGGGGPGRP